MTQIQSPSSTSIFLTLVGSLTAGTALSVASAIESQVNSIMSDPLVAIVPTVLIVMTMGRFIPGNMMHIRDFGSAKEELRLERSPPMWYVDMVVIMIESVLFLLMSRFLFGAPDIFYGLIAVLLYLDILWVIASNVRIGQQWRWKDKYPKFPEPELTWSFINVMTVGVLYVILVSEFPAPEYTMPGALLLLCWFAFTLVFDLWYYHIYRHRQKKRSPTMNHFVGNRDKDTTNSKSSVS